MSVNHRGLEISMSQEFLYRPDVIAVFQEVCRKTVPQGMQRSLLIEAIPV
jgi:hypothetical protein